MIGILSNIFDSRQIPTNHPMSRHDSIVKLNNLTNFVEWIPSNGANFVEDSQQESKFVELCQNYERVLSNFVVERWDLSKFVSICR